LQQLIFDNQCNDAGTAYTSGRHPPIS